jgi:hypothetical protein
VTQRNMAAPRLVPIQFLPIDKAFSKHMNYVTPRQEKKVFGGNRHRGTNLGHRRPKTGPGPRRLPDDRKTRSSLTVADGSQFPYTALPTPATPIGDLKSWRLILRCARCFRKVVLALVDIAKRHGASLPVWGGQSTAFAVSDGWMAGPVAASLIASCWPSVTPTASQRGSHARSSCGTDKIKFTPSPDVDANEG